MYSLFGGCRPDQNLRPFSLHVHAAWCDCWSFGYDDDPADYTGGTQGL